MERFPWSGAPFLTQKQSKPIDKVGKWVYDTDIEFGEIEMVINIIHIIMREEIFEGRRGGNEHENRCVNQLSAII